MNKIIKILYIGFLAGGIISSLPVLNLDTKEVEADFSHPGVENTLSPEQISNNFKEIQRFPTIGENSFLSILSPEVEKTKDRLKINVVVTGYSSSEDETDDDPFITASGKTVRQGIIATNILPFGTKIKIPSLYKDTIFVVEDRMHPRKKKQIDIWFSSKEEALKFGIKKADIEIIGEI